MSPSHLPQAAWFKSFVDRQLVVPIARNQTRNSHISWEDAAQVAYTKLWQVTCAGQFRQGSLEDYCHWASRVCCFAITDFLRHSQQRQHLSLNQPLPGTDILLIDTLEDTFNIMDTVECTELQQQILNSLTDLDHKYSTTHYSTIFQAILLGKKQNEIAQDLNLAPSKISRDLKKIRIHLENMQYLVEHYLQKISQQQRTNEPC